MGLHYRYDVFGSIDEVGGGVYPQVGDIRKEDSKFVFILLVFFGDLFLGEGVFTLFVAFRFLGVEGEILS